MIKLYKFNYPSRTGSRRSCTFPWLFQNNYKTQILWNKQEKVQLRGVPDQACSTLVITNIF